LPLASIGFCIIRALLLPYFEHYTGPVRRWKKRGLTCKYYTCPSKARGEPSLPNSRLASDKYYFLFFLVISNEEKCLNIVTSVRKDYLSISNQVYYSRLFTNVQNFTTIYIFYKQIYKKIIKTHLYRHKVIKKQRSLKLRLN
jgi:hypothetical protein